MARYLSLQATYTTYQLGLYLNNACIAFVEHDKKNASKELLIELESLLNMHNWPLGSLDFISINQGPGPFTSLRIIITTANALAFATHIPLVGINSLDALLDQAADPAHPLSIALLNAYNNDLYYALEDHDYREQGCKNNRLLFAELKERYPHQAIRFIGNGTLLNKDIIQEIFGSHAPAHSLLQEASLDHIAQLALEKFKAGQTASQLMPLYLKTLSYQPAQQS